MEKQPSLINYRLITTTGKLNGKRKIQETATILRLKE
jgi:hypothetical protein